MMKHEDDLPYWKKLAMQWNTFRYIYKCVQKENCSNLSDRNFCGDHIMGYKLQYVSFMKGFNCAIDKIMANMFSMVSLTIVHLVVK